MCARNRIEEKLLPLFHPHALVVTRVMARHQGLCPKGNDIGSPSRPALVSTADGVGPVVSPLREPVVVEHEPVSDHNDVVTGVAPTRPNPHRLETAVRVTIEE